MVLTAPLSAVAASLALLGGAPVRISGATPVPRSCEGASVQRSSEVEPSIAATPGEPRVLVAAWQQDRYAARGGAAALGVAFSRDGGASWQPAAAPGLSGCAGGHARVSDPWVSIGPDGTAYLAAIPGVVSGDRLRTGAAVAVSHDGGASWSEPHPLADVAGPFDDKISVTADPTRPGHASVVWSELRRIRMSRTTDGGATWSPAAAIATASPHEELNVSTISVAPDGTLLHAYLRIADRGIALVVASSSDGGDTWSAPTRVAPVHDFGAVDHRNGISARTEPVAAPAVAAGPGARAYAAWSAAGHDGIVRTVVARSTDSGRTWSRPRVAIGGDADSFSPALAVGADGAVCVSAYRFGPARGHPRAVAALSHDGGVSWRTIGLSAPFSMRDAPRAGDDRFLGDYSGLTPLAGGGFAAALALAPPLATSGPSDVFMASIAPNVPQ